VEPRREKPQAPRPGTEDMPKRFRIIKLEERIAPKNNGKVASGGEGHGGLVSIE
jgi:hypothetical protein